MGAAWRSIAKGTSATKPNTRCLAKVKVNPRRRLVDSADPPVERWDRGTEIPSHAPHRRVVTQNGMMSSMADQRVNLLTAVNDLPR